jgi:hypothetical protein
MNWFFYIGGFVIWDRLLWVMWGKDKDVGIIEFLAEVSVWVWICWRFL